MYIVSVRSTTDASSLPLPQTILIWLLFSTGLPWLGGRRGSVILVTRPPDLGHRVYTQPLQKCDAKRPCGTCVNSGGESGCFYEELRTPHDTIRGLPYAAPEFPFSDEDTPGPLSGGSFSQWSLDSAEDITEPSEDLGQQPGRPTRLGPDTPVCSSDLVRRYLIKLPSASHVSQDSESFVPEETEHCVRSRPRHPRQPLPLSTGPRLIVLPSLRLPIIPRPLHTSLSFFPPENFQVSEGTSGTMSLYAFLTAPLIRRLS